MPLNDNIKSINDLPIYDDEKSALNRQVVLVRVEHQKNAFEEAITSARRATFDFLNKYREQKEKSLELYDKTKNDLNQKLDYLRQESVVLPKIVFISLSGFGGLLLGFRRSNFRKILYSGALTTTATALCFPNQTRVYTNKARQLASENAEFIYRTYIWPSEKVTKKPVVSKESVKPMPSQTVVNQVKDQM